MGILERVSRIGKRCIATGFAVAMIAACGSYTKHDFVERANGICFTTLRSLRAAQAQGGGVAGYLRRAVPLVRSEYQQLDGLKRPPGTAAQRALLQRYLRALAGSLSTLETLDRAASSRDSAAVSSAETLLQASPAPALAVAYGITDCGSPGATVGR